MNTMPREMIPDYKFCMSCGQKQTIPYNMEIAHRENGTFVYLKCTKCKNEIRHEVPPVKSEVTDKTPCRKCGGKVEIIKSKHEGNKHLKKAYYFTHYYKCTKCNTNYMNNKFKVINK